MLQYFKRLINKKEPEELHNYCALGSFFVVAGVVIALTIALLQEKRVGVEFCSAISVLASFAGYLVKKGSEVGPSENKSD